ncbi:MAG: nucleotidyltransferase domain-containing protein [Treponema sp.]|uniref:nucleotidyltransferase domain-containing protein n=1 Tax=Treponema sp. TaxID=166 RepID=UPI003FA20490
MGLFWITMRLTEETKNIIIESICEFFSQVEKIILFGSCVDDNKRGGNIDILIQTPLSSAEAFEKKLWTLAVLQLKLGEQRIDILTTSGADDERLIVQNAYRQGVVLWTTK